MKRETEVKNGNRDRDQEGEKEGKEKREGREVRNNFRSFGVSHHLAQSGEDEEEDDD